MLFEETLLFDQALPISEFREHLRLGSGFSDDAVENRMLSSFLQAAVSAIETRTGKILLKRTFLWSVRQWSGVAAQRLPIAPVADLLLLRISTLAGDQTDIDLSGYRLDTSFQAPRLVALSGTLPVIPSGGHADIQFTAGFGSGWKDVPADLAHAAFLLGAHYYEYRSETALDAGCMPFGVSSLIERYRDVRIGLGEV